MEKPKPLQRDYDVDDLKRLIGFYLACIEEEDLKSLTFRLSQLRRSFLSPWNDCEPLLTTNSPEVEIEWDFADREFLLRGADQAGNAQRLFYGYPVYVDREDMIVPLFFTEVSVTRILEMGHERFLLRPVDPEAIQFNYHLLRRQQYPIEEIQEMQEYLEGSFGSFHARLAAAFQHLGEEPRTTNALDPFPAEDSPRESWYYRPILFRNERSNYTSYLRRELDALRRCPRFIGEAFGTALRYLFAPNANNAAMGEGLARPEARFIEVRPLNASQERAMLSGLTAPLTVVTGPPGTGKSQVVINLLANAALSGQTVLFASKNNKAVDVVRSWLQDILGIDRDWTFRVGSRQRMAEMREEMADRLARLQTDLDELAIDEGRETIDRLTAEIRSLQELIDGLRVRVIEYHRALEACRKARANLPADWIPAESEALGIQLDATMLERLRREAQALASGGNPGLMLWFLKIFFGRRLLEKYLQSLVDLAGGLPEAARGSIQDAADEDLSWETLAQNYKRLSDFNRWLAALRKAKSLEIPLLSAEEADSIRRRLERAKEERSIASRSLLRSVWTRRIEPSRQRAEYLVRRYFDLADRLQQGANRTAWRELRDDFESTCRELMRYFPAWIVTNLSARRALPLTSNMFDLLIVDEASQCDIASALPLLFRARRAIVIGDPHQLRHISTLSPGKECELAEACEAANMLTDWSYTARSLYDVSASAALTAGDAPILLVEHYRSHYGIIEFSNRTFYGRSLVLRTNIPALAEKLGDLKLGIFWHETNGSVPNTARSAHNDAEIAAIMKAITAWYDSGLLDRQGLTLGIVAPFRAQVDRLESRLQNQPWYEALQGRITVGTAHTFQGDEADVVLFSPVVAEGINRKKADWVAKTDQLLNVAITRARGALHIFGDLNACMDAGGYLGQLAEYARHGAGQGEGRHYESKAEEEMAKLLETAGLWYRPQYEEGRYRLDFFVVSPFGRRYDVEVDGRQHWRAEELDRDAVRDAALEGLGYRVVRVNAGMILNEPEMVLGVLRRLC